MSDQSAVFLQAFIAFVGTAATGIGGWALIWTHKNSVQIGRLMQKNEDDEWMGKHVADLSERVGQQSEKIDNAEKTIMRVENTVNGEFKKVEDTLKEFGSMIHDLSLQMARAGAMPDNKNFDKR